jgi:hypothetical protein
MMLDVPLKCPRTCFGVGPIDYNGKLTRKSMYSTPWVAMRGSVALQEDCSRLRIDADNIRLVRDSVPVDLLCGVVGTRSLMAKNETSKRYRRRKMGELRHVGAPGQRETGLSVGLSWAAA